MTPRHLQPPAPHQPHHPHQNSTADTAQLPLRRLLLLHHWLPHSTSHLLPQTLPSHQPRIPQTSIWTAKCRCCGVTWASLPSALVSQLVMIVVAAAPMPLQGHHRAKLQLIDTAQPEPMDQTLQLPAMAVDLSEGSTRNSRNLMAQESSMEVELD